MRAGTMKEWKKEQGQKKQSKESKKKECVFQNNSLKTQKSALLRNTYDKKYINYYAYFSQPVTSTGGKVSAVTRNEKHAGAAEVCQWINTF